MPDVLQTAIEGSHHAGLQFIWVISVGQLLTIGVALLGGFAFIVRMGAVQKSILKNLGSIDKKVDETSDTLTSRVNTISQHVSRVEVETMQDRRELQRSINELNNTLLHLKIASSANTSPSKTRRRSTRKPELKP